MNGPRIAIMLLAVLGSGCVSDFEPGHRTNDVDATVQGLPDSHRADETARPVADSSRDAALGGADGGEREPTPNDSGGASDLGLPADGGGIGMDARASACVIERTDRGVTPLALHISGWSDATTGDSALVEFRVVALDGAPVRGERVFFDVDGDLSGDARLDPDFGETDELGRVVTRLRSDRPGVFSVRAHVGCDATQVGAAGRQIVVRGGPPSQRGFFLTCAPAVVPALAARVADDRGDQWTFEPAEPVVCEATLFDAWGDPIGLGVPVQFRTEAGRVPAIAFTDETGRAVATVDVDQPPPWDVEPTEAERTRTRARHAGLEAPELLARTGFNPRDGVVRVVAVTAGIEGFNDRDGDGLFAMGIDEVRAGDERGDPFVDADDSGAWDDLEVFFDSDGDGLYSLRADGWADERPDLWVDTTFLITAGPDPLESRLTAAPCAPDDDDCLACDPATGCEPGGSKGCPAGAMFALRPGGAIDLELVVSDLNGNCAVSGADVALVLPAGPTWRSDPETLVGQSLRDRCAGGVSDHPYAAPMRLRLRDTRAAASSGEAVAVSLDAVLTSERSNGETETFAISATICQIPAEVRDVPDALPVFPPDVSVPVDAGRPVGADVAHVGPVDLGRPDAGDADAARLDGRSPDATPRDLGAPDAADVVDGDGPDGGAWAFPRHFSPIGSEFIGLPAGTFTMGNVHTEVGLVDHEVTLTRPFWFGRTEVTHAQWHAAWVQDPIYLAFERPGLNPECDECPVGGISWQDAARFANVVSDAEGFERCYTVDGVRVSPAYAADPYSCPGYRLPTSAEWEYAARAGTGSTFAYPGSNDARELGWLMDNSGGTTHPVAQRLPNAWDVFDLCGNVGEYTSEWSGPVPTLYSPEPVTDPWGPPNGDPNGWVVFRGDHYLIGPAPTYLPPGAVLPTLMGLNHLGVRLVRTMVEGQGRDR